MADEELDIMALRSQFLHQEVQIVDGSSEDGELGYVVGVTGRSAEPLTVLFYHMGEAKHQNYYRPEDVALTGGEWAEGKQRDQTVRCRKSRFTGLWYVIDGKGPHGVGYGTAGGAWAAYMHEVVGQEPGKEEHGTEECETAGPVAGGSSPTGDVAGGTDAGAVRIGTCLGEGHDDAESGACPAAGEADGTDLGTADTVVTTNQPI